MSLLVFHRCFTKAGSIPPAPGPAGPTSGTLSAWETTSMVHSNHYYCLVFGPPLSLLRRIWASLWR